MKERRQVRIDTLMNDVGKRAEGLHDGIGDLVVFGVGIVAFRYSLEPAHVSWTFGSVTYGL